MGGGVRGGGGVGGSSDGWMLLWLAMVLGVMIVLGMVV